MKKLLVLGLAVAPFLALVGCGNKEPELVNVNPVQPVVVEEEIETVGEIGYPMDELWLENEMGEMELLPGTETTMEIEMLEINDLMPEEVPMVIDEIIAE